MNRFTRLAMLRGTGLNILVIDKYVERLIQLVDRHTILERGRVAWEGETLSRGAAGAERSELALAQRLRRVASGEGFSSAIALHPNAESPEKERIV